MLKRAFEVVGLSVLLMGCSGKLPDCHSEQATDLVLEIINDEFQLTMQMDANEYMNGLMQRAVGIDNHYNFLEIHNIETISHDKSMGIYYCSANFVRMPTEFVEEIVTKSGRELTESQMQMLQRKLINSDKRVYYSIEDQGEDFLVEVEFEN